MRDHSNGQAEQVVDRAHPLAVAPGQVVIWRDDVDASPGQGVERGRERRREGFPLAGPHLGDLALDRVFEREEEAAELAGADVDEVVEADQPGGVDSQLGAEDADGLDQP